MMTQGRFVIGVAVCLAGAVAAPACAADAASPAAVSGTMAAGATDKPAVKAPDAAGGIGKVTTDAALLAAGKKVFLRNCAKCHGPKGDGKGEAASELKTKPRNFLHDPFKFGGSDDELFHTVSEGIPKTDMQAWKDTLSEKARRAAIEYIKSLRTASAAKA